MLVLIAAACATEPRHTGTQTLPQTDVAGTWMGTWTSIAGGGSAQLDLEQRGSTVTGTVRYTGSNHPPESGTVAGTVNGSALVLTQPTSMELTVLDDEMTGRGFAEGVRAQMTFSRRK